MPRYDYRCPNCLAEWEERQSFTDPVVLHCIRCGGPAERVIRLPGVVFKGGGWSKGGDRVGV